MSIPSNIVKITDKASYDIWYDYYNGTNAWGVSVRTEQEKRQAFNVAIAPLLEEALQDPSNTFPPIAVFVEKLQDDPDILAADYPDIIQKYKDALYATIRDPNDLMLNVWADEYLGGLQVGAKENLDKGQWEPLTQGPAFEDLENNVIIFFNEAFDRNEPKDWWDRAAAAIGVGTTTGTGLLGVFADDEAETEKVQQAAIDGDNEVLQAAMQGTISDAVTDPVNELSRLEKNQCLLMSMMFNENSFVMRESLGPIAAQQDPPGYKYLSVTDPDAVTAYNNSLGGGVTTYQTAPPYYGRIIPFYDNAPEELNNKFFTDGNTRDFFSDLTPNDKNLKTMDKSLFYVYQPPGSNDVVEIEIPLSSDGVKAENLDLVAQKLTQMGNILSRNNNDVNDPAVQDLQTEVNTLNSKVDENTDGGTYALESINIKFDGTNPSTARNDVVVEIKFVLSSFAVLNQVITEVAATDINAVTGGSMTEDIRLGLKDLVIAPITGTGASAGIKSLQSNYIPQHNRIRLKVNPSGRSEYSSKGVVIQKEMGKMPLILDLTTIDHSIVRNPDDKVNFSIKYRGFLQSLLNMPYADSLANETIMADRETRLKNIQSVIDENCKPETIREMMRIERATFEAEGRTTFQSFLQSLMDNNKIYAAEFDLKGTSGYTRAQALRDIPGAGVAGFVTVTGDVQGSFATTGSMSQSSINDLNAAVEDKNTDFGSGNLFSITNPGNQRTDFFMFGDLLNVAANNLYEPDSHVMVDNLKSQTILFAAMPIRIPNPHDSTKPIVINPLQIPISIHFFAQWFHSTVVKKDLSVYPIGSFGRDLLERLVNNLLQEACIKHLLPDEVPPMMRMGYFSSQYFHEVTQDYGASYYYKNAKAPFFIPRSTNFASINGVGQKFSPVNDIGYCVFYQQSPPFIKELNATRGTNAKLKDDKFIPTIVTGRKSVGNAIAKGVSFSKNTAPFLREARYFNNDLGSLALMNNVYDLKFEIKGLAANTYFYPGMLFNFILSDFGDAKGQNGVSQLVGRDNYPETDNDPHYRNSTSNEVTIAHLLGFGGYYITKSVNYRLLQSNEQWTITVDAKFLGTDADIHVKRDKSVIESIGSDRESCFNAYNEAVRIYQSTAGSSTNEAIQDQKNDFPMAIDKPEENLSTPTGVQNFGNRAAQIQSGDIGIQEYHESLSIEKLKKDNGLYEKELTDPNDATKKILYTVKYDPDTGDIEKITPEP